MANSVPMIVIPAIRKAGIHFKTTWMPDYNLGHDEKELKF